MFYYRENLPAKGTIVVAQLIPSEENDSCLYVTLPEYNNTRGIIQKSELPKKVKKLRETLNDMKHRHNGALICVASGPTKHDSGFDLVELSIRGIDKKHEPKILTRQRNMERIIKLTKFISTNFNLPCESLMFELQNCVVLPLMIDDIVAMDDTNDYNIDDYNEKYFNFLKHPQNLLTEIKIDPESENCKNILMTLKTMIKETNATSTLDFDVKIWKSDGDSNIINVIRSLFEFIKSTYNNVELRYIGSPTYQINFNSIDPNAIDHVYGLIKQSIINWLINNNVVGYDLQFDVTQIKVKYGDITIHYPEPRELREHRELKEPKNKLS